MQKTSTPELFVVFLLLKNIQNDNEYSEIKKPNYKFLFTDI